MSACFVIIQMIYYCVCFCEINRNVRHRFLPWVQHYRVDVTMIKQKYHRCNRTSEISPVGTRDYGFRDIFQSCSTFRAGKKIRKNGSFAPPDIYCKLEVSVINYDFTKYKVKSFVYELHLTSTLVVLKSSHLFCTSL